MPAMHARQQPQAPVRLPAADVRSLVSHQLGPTGQQRLLFVAGRGALLLLQARCQTNSSSVSPLTTQALWVQVHSLIFKQAVRLMLAPAGKVLNYAGVSQLTPAEISARAAKILRFIDLGGHERYMKTALYGMTCMVRWCLGQPGAAKASMCAAFRPI